MGGGGSGEMLLELFPYNFCCWVGNNEKDERTIEDLLKFIHLMIRYTDLSVLKFLTKFYSTTMLRSE